MPDVDQHALLLRTMGGCEVWTSEVEDIVVYSRQDRAEQQRLRYKQWKKEQRTAHCELEAEDESISMEEEEIASLKDAGSSDVGAMAQREASCPVPKSCGTSFRLLEVTSAVFC